MKKSILIVLVLLMAASAQASVYTFTPFPHDLNDLDHYVTSRLGIGTYVRYCDDFILLHKLYKRSHGKDRPIKKEYEFLTFPSYYYDDVLDILNSLLFFKVKDRSMDSAIQFVLEKRQASGKWLLERTIRPSALHAKFEEKGDESKWITFRVLNMLKLYNEVR